MKVTYHTAIAAFVSALIALGALGYMMHAITQMGSQLAERMSAIETANKKLVAYKELKATYERTVDIRAELASFALTEDEAADFLTEVERAGAREGVRISTNAIKVEKKKDTPDTLVVQFGIEGKEEAVRHMISLFEQLPYRSYLGSLALTRTNETYAATLDVMVFLVTYDQ